MKQARTPNTCRSFESQILITRSFWYTHKSDDGEFEHSHGLVVARWVTEQ